MFLNITHYSKQDFESVVTAHLSQSSNTVTILFFSNSFFLILTHPLKHTDISSWQSKQGFVVVLNVSGATLLL